MAFTYHSVLLTSSRCTDACSCKLQKLQYINQRVSRRVLYGSRTRLAKSSCLQLKLFTGSTKLYMHVTKPTRFWGLSFQESAAVGWSMVKSRHFSPECKTSSRQREWAKVKWRPKQRVWEGSFVKSAASHNPACKIHVIFAVSQKRPAQTDKQASKQTMKKQANEKSKETTSAIVALKQAEGESDSTQNWCNAKQYQSANAVKHRMVQIKNKKGACERIACMPLCFAGLLQCKKGHQTIKKKVRWSTHQLCSIIMYGTCFGAA